ncbi:MAG: tetraacyldisaccharide 4'-kinase [Allomuricauda sp.]
MQRFLRKIAFPFSPVYALVVHIRNFLYDVGFFKSVSFTTPTLCVGNLSVGGTGKTPMVEYLIRLLEGHKIAVLSRGYKRKSTGFLLAGPESTVNDLGDEPYQLFRKFPKISLAVDADRRNGIARLEALVKPDIILLDDAFQHRRVKPSFSILLTAYGNLFVDDWYLPSGTLRDSKKEADRANMVIVTKCPESISDAERTSITRKLRLKSHQSILFSKLRYSDSIQGEGGTIMELSQLKGKEVALVTGIASPRPLLDYLKSKEIESKHFEFGDHHNFTEKEIQSFSHFQIILTTEKDYVRLAGRTKSLYYLEVAHGFDAKDKKMLESAVNGLV